MSGRINGIISSRIFRNETALANKVTSIPTGLNYFRDGTNLYLTWKPAGDDQTISDH